jgi:hypothetical protein
MQLVVLSRLDSSRLVIKLIKSFPYIRSRISISLRRPLFISFYIVFLLQILQLQTNYRISLIIPN